MRSSKPPALATWLIEHLIPGGKNEGLTGDLLERFREGHSAAWYWRQVLIAISMRLSNELHILWLAIVFTAVWSTAYIHFFENLNRTALFKTVMGWGITFPWPVSGLFVLVFFTAINAVPLLAALSIYLGTMRTISLRSLSRGLFMGAFAYALSIVLGMIVFHPRSRQHPDFLTYMIGSLPFFLALLLSMWLVRPKAESLAKNSA